jgi:valyl-tRNA synthetase
MEIPKHYNPGEVEEKWYVHWESRGYFDSVPDDREPFSIVIPPPNVTGVLHMGHMLNNAVQDILIRKAKLDGKNTCWVPGTDHASIATEAKVVRMLREKGIKKSDLSREEFLDFAWEWREKYGGIILQQLRKLGAACDWKRTAFTLDETRSKSVLKVFVDLYRKGKVYRGLRMINWDPLAQTVLSNEEVIYNDEDSNLYHVRYPVEGTSEFITVATTRPETILGDTAIAVHPKDERYQDFVGKFAIVPLVERRIPIIADKYVDTEFGTGALKITPAHDPNDYEIGLTHKLEVIDVLNADGTMSEAGGFFIGEDRDIARKMMTKELEERGLLVGQEVYRHSVGRSERTNVVVEPRLSLQWYVDMKSLADPALRSVMEDEIKFFPEKYKNMYRHWMENIRDWCISRQLWWGQRIPAYYLRQNGEDKVFVAETPEEALKMAREETGNSNLKLEDLHQDEDVVDTWFSSWLWPISVFDGFETSEEIDYYYPTSVLVTGWDIIFLWVARMIMAGYEWRSKRPFDHVYFTGMVRDKQGRKMSKSLGNSPDALKLIEEFGADGVRFGILSASPAGGDLLFEEKMCEQGRNFCNKMWNALRLTKGWEITEDEPVDVKNALAVEWIEARLSKVVEETNERFAQYRLSEALMGLYSFVWGDFCSWYLEMIKPAYEAPIDRVTFDKTNRVFASICSLLHPFMPFITEEIWHQLSEDEQGTDCMNSSYPVVKDYDVRVLNMIEGAKELVTKVRELRNANQVSQGKSVDLFAGEGTLLDLQSNGSLRALISKVANIGNLVTDHNIPEDAIPFVVQAQKFSVKLPIERNIEEERARLEKDLEYHKGFIRSVMKKLGNESFVQNAPDAVVAIERKKLADGEEKIKMIEETLAGLG